MKSFFLTSCIGMFFIFPLYAQTQDNAVNTIEIKIMNSDKIITATLTNSRAAQDFLDMLPLILTLNDYGQNEKVSDLPCKLSIAGSPSGYTPRTGDIAYYGPWGNLAIFRHDFAHSNGLIKLGQINGQFDALDVSGPINVLIDVEER